MHGKTLLVASMPAACMQSYLGPIAKNYIVLNLPLNNGYIVDLIHNKYSY